MEPQINKLLTAFQSNGWTLKGSVDVSSDWWFKDILHLVSTIRPINTDLYLTLLTEPQITDKKVVWSISISSTMPDSRQIRNIEQITLNDIKKTDLKQFVAKINSIVLK